MRQPLKSVSLNAPVGQCQFALDSCPCCFMLYGEQRPHSCSPGSALHAVSDNVCMCALNLKMVLFLNWRKQEKWPECLIIKLFFKGPKPIDYFGTCWYSLSVTEEFVQQTERRVGHFLVRFEQTALPCKEISSHWKLFSPGLNGSSLFFGSSVQKLIQGSGNYG